MSFFEAFLLGVIEGLTEFLPISSTGHMVLTSWALGIAHDPFVKSFEVIIQAGAIATVVIMYWRRFLPNLSFYKKIFIAFVPTAIIGFLLKDFVDLWLGNVALVAWALILGGFFLIWLDRSPRFRTTSLEGRGVDDLSWKDCFWLGVIQCFALVPGVSRSGATISGGLILGMSRREAAEFSFFLAVPTMAAATCYKLFKLYRSPEVFGAEEMQLLAVGFVTALIVAGLAIKAFLGLLQRFGFAAFGWYRVILGVGILLLLLRGTELQLD